jgi:hypothetical protein
VAQLEAEAESYADCAVTHDFAEGIAAAVRHRAPHFDH